MEDTYLAKEIEYSALLTDLYKKKQSHETVLQFFQKEAPLYETNNESELIPLCFQKENNRFMSMFDFAVTQCGCYEDSEILLNEAFKYCNFKQETDYGVFCMKFKTVFDYVGKKYNKSARDVLVSSNFQLDIDEYKKEEELFEQLEYLYKKFGDELNTSENGCLNSNHKAHATYAKLQEICSSENNRSYLNRLFTYLKAFSKVLYIQQNNSSIVAQNKNTSFFEMLKYNRALLVGKLLFENNLDPADFEETFVKLKLDLLYHIAGNCFPTINLHKQEIVSSEELYPENRLYVPTDSIMIYVQKRNWLLAYILSEIYNVQTINIDLNRMRIRHFENYIKSSRIQHLRVLFDGSEIITALQNEVDSDKLISFIQKRMESDTANMTSSYSSEDSVENAEEMSEEHLKAIDWKYLFDIVDSIPENEFRKSEDYINLRDLIIKSMVSELYEFNYQEYVQYISNARLRIETILGSFETWPVDFCIRILKKETSSLQQTDRFEQKILKSWIEKLELYKLVCYLNTNFFQYFLFVHFCRL